MPHYNSIDKATFLCHQLDIWEYSLVYLRVPKTMGLYFKSFEVAEQ